MKRVLFVVGLIAAIALGSHKTADATSCTIPNVFTNGTSADANQVNANFSSLQSCGNNIDHTNIGSLGIYATQIVPLSVGQAVFGGSFGYAFDPNDPGQVPLTIVGAMSQTADLFDIYNGGQTTKYVWVDSSGNLHAQGVPSLSSANVFTAQVGFTHAGINGVYVQPTTDGTPALFAVFNAAQSKSMFRVDDIDANNGVAFVSKNGVLGVLPPVFTASGNIVASTLHGVQGTCAFASSNTCAVTFSGGAAFTSSTSYWCGATAYTGFSGVTFQAGTGTSGSFQTQGGANANATVAYYCVGT